MESKVCALHARNRFRRGPQYKCSTCPNYLLCDICQNIITEERNDQYEDNDWEYLLPHEATHSVYRTEVPDSSSPSVLHTSHPPHGTDLEHEKTPAERKRIQCFCVLHADTKDHNTPECPEWTSLEGTTDLEYRCQENDYCWDALKRYNCCIGCLMQGHSIGKCSNVPPRCLTCAVCHNKRLLCHGMEVEELGPKAAVKWICQTGQGPRFGTRECHGPSHDSALGLRESPALPPGSHWFPFLVPLQRRIVVMAHTMKKHAMSVGSLGSLHFLSP